ncbi:MAG: T9SS type A sorting domain-containing protein [Bacteroidales bacterium]|nr:T9SS type A sorting domain-containing protein [Bacteroidales bacterium]
MKKVTLFVLSLGLMFGALAQNFGVLNTSSLAAGLRQAKPAVKIDSKQVNVKTVTASDLQFVAGEDEQYGKYIDAYFNVTFDESETNALFAKLLISTDDLNSFSGQGYTTDQLCEAIIYQCGQYLPYFCDSVKVGTLECVQYYAMGIMANIDPSTEYQLFIYTFDIVDQQLANGKVVETGLTAKSSAYGGTGTAEVTLTILDVTSSRVNFTSEINDQVNYYYLLCAPTDTLESYNLTTAEAIFNYGLRKYTNGYGGEGAYIGDTVDGTDNALTPNTEYTLWAVPANANEEMGEYDKKVFTTKSATGLNDVQEMTSVTVYPNPTSDYVRVSSLNTINNVELVNTLGQVVYSTSVKANGYNIPVANLEKGTYFVKVKTANGVNTSKVLVK